MLSASSYVCLTLFSNDSWRTIATKASLGSLKPLPRLSAFVNEEVNIALLRSLLSLLASLVTFRSATQHEEIFVIERREKWFFVSVHIPQFLLAWHVSCSLVHAIHHGLDPQENGRGSELKCQMSRQSSPIHHLMQHSIVMLSFSITN